RRRPSSVADADPRRRPPARGRGAGSEPARPRPPSSATRVSVTPAAAAARLDGDVRLAVLHLRVGMLVVARSELEDLERRGLLDALGWAWLAEARWRSGDMEDAATAARAHLDAGGDDP